MTNLKTIRVFCLVAMASVCSCNFFRTPWWRTHIELVKITMRIKAAEQEFYAAHQRYGALDELDPDGANPIAGQIVNGRYRGYRIELEVHADRYRLQAIPELKSSVQRDSYFCDQTGVIRWAPVGRLADESSAPLR